LRPIFRKENRTGLSHAKSFILDITSVTLRKGKKNWSANQGHIPIGGNQIVVGWHSFANTWLYLIRNFQSLPTPISHQTKNSSWSFTDPKGILNVCRYSWYYRFLNIGNAPYLETEPREIRHLVLQYASCVSLKLTYMYIQINKSALSLEEEKQISHEAQQVEELWRTLSYFQWLSVYFKFRILSWDGVHATMVNSSALEQLNHCLIILPKVILRKVQN